MNDTAGIKVPVMRKKRNVEQRRETAMGFFFVGPMLIGLTIFTLLPILATMYLSLTEWNFIAGIDKIKFVGLDNFIRLFHDPIFLQSMKNNAVLMITIPITMLISLLLAIIINKHVYLKGFFKVIYFMPYISTIVAIAVVYQVLFHPSFGPVNQFLMSIGVDNPPKWLADIKFSLYSVMMIQVWSGIGFSLIIYMAGLQNIPQDLYEAADIDGASTWHKLHSITLPMLSPTSFFLLVTGIIGTFKIYDLIAVLTSGGPADSTNVMVYYLVETAFVNLKTGYASSMGIMLLIITLAITMIQWVAQKKWVNY
ncbi:MULTISPECIES: carbohydrate ABC transporter permease [unclassified Paenibacillus]|uniref:carbohydrate ABC transporter permease n=1 Tax=unclassified Paenibacillus TaxID=185978 RepID=UPI0027891EEC|nr:MULTISPECIES: sugar ABC transporter permease [unclassified Paenibacillus]MDQ0902088.1 multiple sugar transport system permease protein [Paenibacillus sp. V4I7]MDQ0919418.1 multiple sugar transport system permease protein [Paenibacillus sp. V4I5]